MNTVYLLVKHPTHPYSRGYLKQYEVEAVYVDRTEPDRIVAEKNSRPRAYYFYEVIRKTARVRAAAALKEKQ